MPNYRTTLVLLTPYSVSLHSKTSSAEDQSIIRRNLVVLSGTKKECGDRYGLHMINGVNIRFVRQVVNIYLIAFLKALILFFIAPFISPYVLKESPKIPLQEPRTFSVV